MLRGSRLQRHIGVQLALAGMLDFAENTRGPRTQLWGRHGREPRTARNNSLIFPPGV